MARLPIFHGETLDACVGEWRALQRTEKANGWHKAAVAASLERLSGQRTDSGNDGPTPIQQFCATIRIGPSYVSRLAKTHQVISQLLDTGSKRSLPDLLADETLSFKHFLIAANCAVLPVEALLEARDQQWSANELARVLTSRKDRTLIDAATDCPVRSEADDDDDDVEWRNTPERVAPNKTPRGIKTATFALTTNQYRTVTQQLRDLSVELNTPSTIDTLLTVLAWAHRELAKRKTGEVAA